MRLVGLPEGAEGSNAAGFLRVNLSKWIPSLKGRDIEIDRAHRVYQGRAETFGGAGAQSIKGAHGTRLLIGLCSLLICVSKWMLLY